MANGRRRQKRRRATANGLERWSVGAFKRFNVVTSMSRRRRKKQRHHGPSLSASSPAALRQNGLRAFRQHDFSNAVAQWGRLNLEAEPAVRPALAEAHFRRALAVREVSPAIADLTRALELLPAEARYRYHLGLAYHRAGRLAEALEAYARAAEAGFRREGVGLARGLAEIERNPHLDLGTLGWLSPEERAALSPVAALLRGDTRAALASDPGNWIDRLKERFAGNSASRLWRGLAHLAAGQAGEALAALTLPPGQSLPADAETVRVFYRGLALAATGDREAALAEWAAAAARRPTPRLQAALAGVHVSRVRALLEAGAWAEALKAAQAALRLIPGQRALVSAVLVAHNRLANEAARRGEWKEAAAHWEEMRTLLATAPVFGPVAPILHNMAIAHEALGEWEAAAGAWRALMGTLPRRQSRARAVEPDGRSLSVAGQRAWMRRRVLDCYKKAGQPDQAIALYRQAVKASPDDLDLRLELANALLANGRVIAGRNELLRILEKDPKHIEAQVRLAEAHQQRGEERDAERLLRAALETEPGCEPARRGLVEIVRRRGHAQFNAGRVAQSAVFYRAGLELAPDDVDLLVSLGYAELKQRNPVAARAHFEAALVKGETAAYLEVFRRWVLEKDMEEARQVLARAEAAGVVSAHFYVDAAEVCFDNLGPPDALFSLFGPPRAKRRPRPDRWEALGRELIQRAEGAGGDQNEVLRHILAAIGPTQPGLGLDYAQRWADRLPDDPTALTTLSLFQAMNDQMRPARETLRRAADLARKQGNSELLGHIEDLRRQLNNPLFGLASRMASMFASFEE